MEIFGQAHQDKFVLKITKEKTYGVFLEIGSNHPIKINNTYTLEKNYSWRGIMIELYPKFLSLYVECRKNSFHVIKNATEINYLQLFIDNNIPINFDYISLDLEVADGSTLKTLEALDEQIFDTYKSAVITFEHDFYREDFFETRKKSREIFNKRGYFLLFSDVSNCGDDPFEDWYVHPDLVDMEYVNELKLKNINQYKNLTKTTLRILSEPIMSINYKNIIY
jgi:hypothetical protein